MTLPAGLERIAREMAAESDDPKRALPAIRKRVAIVANLVWLECSDPERRGLYELLPAGATEAPKCN